MAMVLILLFAVPVLGLKLGTVAVQPSDTVTVTGFARQEQQNQVAVFSAGVTNTNSDRATAVEAVNTAVNELLASLKEFGIAEDDLQTQNLSLYQIDEPLFQGTRTPGSQGESVWQANNSVEIKLRDASRASELSSLLTSSGATNVYGPSFQLDDSENPEDALISDAIDNAREKAGQIAVSSGKKLGGVVNVSEGSSGGGYYPMPMAARGAFAEAADVQPGTSTVSKSMTVTFSLKPSWYFWPW